MAIIEGDFQWRILDNAGQRLAEAGIGFVPNNVFLHLRRLELIQPLIEAFDRPKLMEQLEGSLLPYPFNTWIIIRAIAHETLEVDNLLRRQLVLIPNAGRRVRL